MRSSDKAMRALDAEARLLARREFEKPVVLEAGAGSGKTATLVARVLVWSLGPGWKRASEATDHGPHDEVAACVLEGITAITFTDRAAVEMKERIAQAVEKLTRPTPEAPIGLDLDELPETDRLRDRARALLVEIDRLHVETIHAFCRRTLARHPLEAGLRPEFGVDADGSAVENAVQDLLSSRLDALYGDDADADALALLEQGFGPERVGEALRELAAADCPARSFEVDPYSESIVDEARQRVLALTTSVVEIGAEPFRAGGGRAKGAVAQIEAIEALR